MSRNVHRCCFACGGILCSGNFEILHGDGYKLLDTTIFLKSLSRLAEMTNENTLSMSEPPLLREWLAAAGIFDWKVMHSITSFLFAVF